MDTEAKATLMVGDGKTPNKFFLSISSDYYVIINGECQRASEQLAQLKQEGRTILEFDSYEKAKEKADGYILGQQYDGITVNCVTLEDRLHGEVYERTQYLNINNANVFEDCRESH